VENLSWAHVGQFWPKSAITVQVSYKRTTTGIDASTVNGLKTRADGLWLGWVTSCICCATTSGVKVTRGLFVTDSIRFINPGRIARADALREPDWLDAMRFATDSAGTSSRHARDHLSAISDYAFLSDCENSCLIAHGCSGMALSFQTARSKCFRDVTRSFGGFVSLSPADSAVPAHVSTCGHDDS